jgi:ribosomal protein S17E
MGRIRTSNIKRLSFELAERYSDSLSDDYEKNKEFLNTLNLKVDKSVRNKIAGYITVIKKRPS